MRAFSAPYSVLRRVLACSLAAARLRCVLRKPGCGTSFILPHPSELQLYCLVYCNSDYRPVEGRCGAYIFFSPSARARTGRGNTRVTSNERTAKPRNTCLGQTLPPTFDHCVTPVVPSVQAGAHEPPSASAERRNLSTRFAVPPRGEEVSKSA